MARGSVSHITTDLWRTLAYGCVEMELVNGRGRPGCGHGRIGAYPNTGQLVAVTRSLPSTVRQVAVGPCHRPRRGCQIERDEERS